MDSTIELSICISMYIFAIFLISIRKSHQPTEASPPDETTTTVTPGDIRCIGLCAAFITLRMPYTAFADDAIAQPAVRCVCFFYACKMLDLVIARADSPPTLLECDDWKDGYPRPAPMKTMMDCARYMFTLLTEMRYQSFDIATEQRRRPLPSRDPLPSYWTWIPLFVIPSLVALIPTAETKSLLLLLAIFLVLETSHSIFHFRRKSCMQPLFYKPFAATSFASFWSTHWHAAAAPFLQTLAYHPGKRYVGKWFGVLATFNLTGIWHAWASTPLVEPEYGLLLGFKVWWMFMVMGLGILGESFIPRERHGGLLHRVLVWAIALGSAGWAFRTLECHSRIGVLRSSSC